LIERSCIAWQSLVRQQALTLTDSVELMAAFVESAAARR